MVSKNCWRLTVYNKTMSRLHQTFLRRRLILLVSALLLFGLGITLGWIARNLYRNDPLFFSPFIEDTFRKPDTSLLKYSIKNLATTAIKPNQITLIEELASTADYTSYVFAYQATGGKITGQVNIPQPLRSRLTQLHAASPTQPLSLDISELLTSTPAIILIRGYYPLESYTIGGGTRNAAAAFAKAGYVTVAPDFLGYGQSDPERTNTWEARFIRPLQVLELLASLEETGLPVPSTETDQPLPILYRAEQVGLWGHSNGGQIAISALEISSRAIPTTLSAPVTAPFPYSILYFGIDQADQGKEQRHWLAKFEEDYDVDEFNLTKHLNLLSAPLQLHHGTADEAAPISWSESFEAMIIEENERRLALSEGTIESTETNLEQVETESAPNDLTPLLDPISLTYYRYPGADHNLQPSWNQVVQRDLDFFNRQFGLGN